MIALRILGANRKYVSPKDWDKDKNGECGVLFVHEVDGYCLSAWEPTPDELATLNSGGRVILQIYGKQPPVAIWADNKVTEE